MSRDQIEVWNATYSAVPDDQLWGENRLPRISEFVDRCQFQEFEQVLDAGCGDGRHLRLFVESRSCHVFGIDASSSALKLCRSRILHHSPGYDNYTLRQELLQQISLADSEVDAAICMDVLVHNDFTTAREILVELCRVVRPGGWILFNLCTNREPTLFDSKMHISDTLTGWYRPDKTRLEYLFEFYDCDRLHKLLDEAMIPANRNVLHSRWHDPPHPGFREYEHDHDGWFILFQNK